MRYAVGIAAVALFALAAPQDGVAQTEFVFSGVWSGEFEDESRPQRDPATRGNTGAAFGLGEGSGRDRLISGTERYECNGVMTLELRGPNDNLRGRGSLDQDCRAARSGLWKIPLETITMEDFEYEDEGEGREKKLKFRFEMRSRSLPSDSFDPIYDGNELVRCNAEGAFKSGDDVFEGRYRCRQDVQQAQTGRRTIAIAIEGEFELKRADEAG